MWKEISMLGEEEKARVQKLYGDLNSSHEAYGVLKEEIEEVSSDVDFVKYYFSKVWENVKKDEDTASNIRIIKNFAIDAIFELIQVKIVCERWEEMNEKNEVK